MRQLLSSTYSAAARSRDRKWGEPLLCIGYQATRLAHPVTLPAQCRTPCLVCNNQDGEGAHTEGDTYFWIPAHQVRAGFSHLESRRKGRADRALRVIKDRTARLQRQLRPHVAMEQSVSIWRRGGHGRFTSCFPITPPAQGLEMALSRAIGNAWEPRISE